MLNSLDIIEDFLKLQSYFYEFTIKEDFYYQRILKNIEKLRKDILKNEEYTKLDV